MFWEMYADEVVCRDVTRIVTAGEDAAMVFAVDKAVLTGSA